MRFKIQAEPGAQVQAFTSAYERRGALTRGWSVSRFYDNATAYCDANALPSNPGEAVFCDTRLGYFLGDPIAEEFSFDDSFSDKERAELQAMTFVPEKFVIEEEYIKVAGPMTVELIGV